MGTKFQTSYSGVSVEDQDDYKSSDRYKTHINGGETAVTISRAGEIILEVFGK